MTTESSNPTNAPSSGGSTPPATPPAAATDTPPNDTPSTEAPPSTETASTPEASSEAAETQEPDPRLVVPETAEAYAVNLADEARAALGITEGDPLIKGLSEFAKANGKPQGYVDDVLEAAAALASQGLLGAPFDPAAEAAKLGENAAGRRSEVETFANALKTRGDLTEGQHQVLMSIAAEADGVTLIEVLRGRMGDNGNIDPPVDAGAGGKEAAIAKAKAMRRDPRYESDKVFRKEADAAFQAAYR